MSSIGTKTLNKIFAGNKEVQSVFIGSSKIYSNSSSSVVDPIFGNNSWETIAQVSETIASQNMNESDIYATYGWSIGDTKSITLSTNEVIEVQIIGFNHDVLSSDHTTKAGITLQMVNCLNTKYKMNNNNTNTGGWNGSTMRTSTLPTIKGLLPNDLQTVIKLVDKKAANGGGSNYSATVTSSDDLFLLCEKEIFGKATYAKDGENEGTQYEYWVDKSASYRIKKVSGSDSAWCERSSRNGNTSSFCIVTTSGSASLIGASSNCGVAFAFCV